MDDAPLDLRLGEHSLDGIRKPGRPSTQKNRTSCTPRFFRSFSIPSQNLEDSFAPTVMLRMSL